MKLASFEKRMRGHWQAAHPVAPMPELGVWFMFRDTNPRAPVPRTMRVRHVLFNGGVFKTQQKALRAAGAPAV